MPAFIDRVPSNEELAKISGERTASLPAENREVSRLDTHLVTIHKQEVVLDSSAESIYDPVDIGLPTNGEYSVVGELQMGVNESVGTVAIVRQQNEAGQSFLLAALSKDAGDEGGGLKISGLLELRKDFSVELGRMPQNTITAENAVFVKNQNLDRDNHISKSHARITFSGDEIVVQDYSTNGSLIRANADVQDIDTHEFRHTARAEDEARLRGHLLETSNGGRFDGRKVVGRETVIDGLDAFVDLRSWVGGGEAIIIDSQKYPDSFDKLRNSFNEIYAKNLGEGLSGEAAVLKSAFDTVSAAMEYDLKFVDFLSTSVSRKTNDKRKIALNYYLDEGRGVCRHMALAVAWMGGELARNGLLEGKMTAEVNQRKIDNAAHEWARYTAKDGTVYILDPAQQYIGRLEESLRRHGSWEYFRPGERLSYEMIEQQRAARLGGVVLPSLSQRINEQ